MNQLLAPIYKSVIDGNNKTICAQVQSALDTGLSAIEVLNEGMVPAMAEVGRLFEIGEYFVPELLISARAMQTGMTVLKPQLVKTNYRSAGKVLLGTVQGDLHDIGKNLVSMMLEGAAFEVIDLGVDVSPEQFVEAVSRHSPDLIALSALLTTTMPNMQATIEALNSAGLRDRVKVIVGGAPINEEFSREIGADGYALDASRAVTLAKSLL